MYAEDISAPFSYDECRSLYGKRKYIVAEKMRVPPMLFTFPGSGTTYTQLLVEYATGVYTGSIYDEDELYSAMPGLAFCGQRLGLVKAHTKDVRFTVGEAKGERRVLAVFHDRPYFQKCHRGAIDHGFSRFLLTIRNPWSSIWSNYQRGEAYRKQYGKVEDSKMDTHTGKIPLDQFDIDDWHRRAEQSPHWGLSEYIRMWHYCYAILLAQTNLRIKDPDGMKRHGWKVFENNFEKKAKKLANSTSRADNSVLIARYEDLTSKNVTLAIESLRNIVQFIGLGTDSSLVEEGNSVDKAYMVQRNLTMDSFPTNLSPEDESNRRLRCASILAENPQVHRSTNATSSATVRTSGAEVQAPTRYVTMADAYSGKNNTQWVCGMWGRMKASVGPELSEFGYYHGPFSSDPPEGCEEEGDGGEGGITASRAGRPGLL